MKIRTRRRLRRALSRWGRSAGLGGAVLLGTAAVVAFAQYGGKIPPGTFIGNTGSGYAPAGPMAGVSMGTGGVLYVPAEICTGVTIPTSLCFVSGQGAIHGGADAIVSNQTAQDLYVDASRSLTLEYFTGGTLSLKLRGGATNVSVSAAGTTLSDSTINMTALPASAGSGGLNVCVDSTGKLYKKSSCP